MAQKRMFDKRITDSDRFTDLPNSSKALYFMAGMNADDRGFFQPRRLQKMSGFTDDDFKVLIAKGYFITFDSGVMVITEWNKNNYLDKNRITETEYIDELRMLRLVNEKYEINTGGLTDVKQMFNQYSIEENSIEKNSIDNIYTFIEKNFGRVLSPVEVELVSKWDDNDLTRYAIKQTVLNRATSLKYTEAILNSYKAKGIKSILEAENEERKRNKREEIPKWFNKEISDITPSNDEQKEMNDLLSEFQEE